MSASLDAPQRKKIERRRQQTRDYRLVMRLSTLLWRDDGMTEAEIASSFRAPLSDCAEPGKVERADGFTWCMSGPNSFQASAAFQRSRWRRPVRGDLVLVHCNSFADGFWTDITRTFYIGEADLQKRRMYEAIFAARAAALEAVRPGARASDVDRAARESLTERGFGEAFKHPTGHGVGFAAIHHEALRACSRSPKMC